MPETHATPAFADVPRTARVHMGLMFYAAVYRIVEHLRGRTEADGRPPEEVLRQYPFLAVYYKQIRDVMPGSTGPDPMDWLRREIEAWEENTNAAVSLPLRTLRMALNLPFPALLAFVLVGIVEEDAQFSALFSALAMREGTQRVSLGLLQQVFGGNEFPEAWLLVRPLLDGGFLEVLNRDAPRSEWELRVPGVLWNVARGEYPQRVLANANYHAPDVLEPLSRLAIGQELREQLTELTALIAGGRTRAIVVRGMPGTNRSEVLGAIAQQLDLGMVEIECPASTLALDNRWHVLGPFCTLTHSLPVFVIDAGPGETFEIPELPGYRGPVGVTIGYDGGVGGPASARALTLQLDLEPPELRLELWKRELNGHAGISSEIWEIAAGFCLPGRYIRQCARLAVDYAALGRRASVAVPDLRQAARAINRQVLDTLATRIDGPASWNHLIVRNSTGLELRSLEGRCRHRERLAARFASSIPGGINRGVRALLEGPSGTGKTLAARVLAAELGLDLYRVDLAAVVNKYIGETEKNLSKVLSRAEDLNVVLLLDEGDSLMTQRTDVKSSNDRYANLETNYLLQRLEHYTGIVVITTNASESIDIAFRRRMDSVVKFHLPDGEERWRLWQVHLPEGHMVDSEALEEMAVRYQLTGGQIRNACVNAALSALARGDATVRTGDLKSAIQAEHRKSGASFIDRTATARARNDRSLNTFLRGLS